MLMKKKKRNKVVLRKEESEYGQLFGSDETFAFIARFTPGGTPYGITHEEMIIIELEEKLSNKGEAIKQ
jgi:hypothetical protein